MTTDYHHSDFTNLEPVMVPAARTTMKQLADITIAVKGWKGREEFCKNFYTTISKSTNDFVATIKTAETEQFRGYSFKLGSEQIDLFKVYLMISSSGNISHKQFPVVAAAFNNLYSNETHYRISKKWELEHIDAPVVESLHLQDADDKVETPADERLSELGYTGKWQGVHFYSRGSFDHKKEVHLLRRICVEILPSYKARLEYMDALWNQRKDVPVLGDVTLGESGLQLFINFSYNIDQNGKYTARAIYCLTLEDHGNLQGAYVGFSPTPKLPYGGAIYLRKLKENEEPDIRNYTLESGSQTMDLWAAAEIEGLKNAYTNYLETPGKSLSKVLHARFRDYKINTELNGDFLTIGIGSGGRNNKELNTLVSCPMHFNNGLCTTLWKKGQKPMEAPVRAIDDNEEHIWLHLYNGRKSTNISYHIEDPNEPEYRGISFRLNANDKLQARTEILIRKDKLQPDEEVRKKYELGTPEYEQLRNTYVDTHPFFKELIKSFESRATKKADNGVLILQNRTKDAPHPKRRVPAESSKSSATTSSQKPKTSKKN